MVHKMFKYYFQKLFIVQLLVIIDLLLQIILVRGDVVALSNFTYIALKDSTSGSYMCAQTEASSDLFARSHLECAHLCRTQQTCIAFNIIGDSGSLNCQFFTYQPNYFQIQNDCIYYELRSVQSSCIKSTLLKTVPAQSCSFPFTYLGQLYYKCIQNVTNVTKCDQYACLMDNRTWAICYTPPGYQAKNITMTITIPTISGSTLVQSVNNWIVIQQQLDGSISFDRPWINYRNGFGTVGSNYWMGNEKVYQLTNTGLYKLRMEMRSKTAGWVSAEYSYFYLDNEANFYRLHLGGFSGDCGGDSMQHPGAFHNGMKFTTSDRQNDLATDGNCAIDRGSGWWYNNCYYANFNAYYNTAFFSWWDLPDPDQYLNAARMMIKRA